MTTNVINTQGMTRHFMIKKEHVPLGLRASRTGIVE